MRIAQINVSGSLSTGRIAAELCRLSQEKGHKAVLCYSRAHAPADVASIRIGTPLNYILHGVLARLTDKVGFYSHFSTWRFIRKLKKYRPDLIHLHNLHGYYLNLKMLFRYLKKADIPVVWTLHDCWAFTGHCAYYTLAKNAPVHNARRPRFKPPVLGCDRWQYGCGRCKLSRSYPATWGLRCSASNWQKKREMFCSLRHMVITTPSEWLHDEVRLSFLKKYPTFVLPSGIDLAVFKPCDQEDYLKRVLHNFKLDEAGEKKIILSVAAVWDERKGLDDLVALADELGDEYLVVAVGVDKALKEFLKGTRVLGVGRTGNVHDLCALYTRADVYVSASREETQGMTLIEALACGTQILALDATAMPEIVTSSVGEIVLPGDINAMAEAVRRMCAEPKSKADCMARAAEYDAKVRMDAYMVLYENMYRHSPAYQAAQERGARYDREA